MIGGVVMKVNNELVIKASRGDKAAFSELYYSCYNDLYKFALYTLGDAEDAADVVELGQVLGYVASPTKYFGEDGTHLNFAMTKDKKPVDPKQFFK